MHQNLIQRTLKATGLSQSALANKIGVSAAQISKWKQGESIPSDRENALRILAGVEDTPLKQLFKRVKDNYLDDHEGIFEDHFDGITEVFIDLLETFGGVTIEGLVSSSYINNDCKDPLAPSPSRNIEDLIHDLLINQQSLERWYEHFIMDIDASGDLFDLGEDIREWFSYLAWSEIDQALLSDLGIDTYQITLSLESVIPRLKLALYNYCQELNRTGTHFTTDYHILIQDKPSRLADTAYGKEMVLLNRAESSMELLPYPYQVLLNKISSLKNQLSQYTEN